MPPRIVNLPPGRKPGGSRALKVSELTDMTPAEIAAFVHDSVTASRPEPKRHVPSMGNRAHIAYRPDAEVREEHARSLIGWARRRVGL